MIIMMGLILNQHRYNCIYHSDYSILKLEKTIRFIRYLEIHDNEQIISPLTILKYEVFNFKGYNLINQVLNLIFKNHQFKYYKFQGH
jgi:hypothetical protein